MKKIIALVLSLAVIFTMSACGGSGEAEKVKNKEGHVADTYYQMMEKDDAKYYYEADVTEEFLDEEDAEPVKRVMAEGRDGKGNFVLLEGETELENRQLDIGKVHYTIADSEKKYAKGKKEEDEMDLSYAGTSEMDLDGKTYQYDEYQAPYEMQGFAEDGEEEAIETYLYRKCYLVDDSGDLKAVVYIYELQGEDGQENEPITRRTERITSLKAEDIPTDLFEVPKDYQEVSLDELSELEEE